MLRALRIVVVLSLILQQPLISVRITRADDPDPNAEAIAAGLKSFATVVDSLAGFEELGEAIPLTALSPSADGALRLGELFTSTLGAKLDLGFPYTSLGQLAAQIDGVDTTYGGVAVTVSGPAPGDGDAVIVQPNGDLIDVQFEVKATRNLPAVPLEFSAEDVDISGGGLSVDLELSTILEFQLDTTVPISPVLPFYLVDDGPSPPSIAVRVSADGSIGTLSALLGFADVTATGNVTLNLQIDVPFDDPDDSGTITILELTSTSVEDLVAGTAFADDPLTDAVNASIDLDTDLIPGSPDATITFVDPDISPAGGGLDATPTLNPGDLADFRNFSAADALGGLGRLVSWLNGLQSTGRLDVELPLLRGTFSDALSISQVLSDTVAALRMEDDLLTPINEAQDPTFDDAVELGEQLATALGLSAITPVYSTTSKILTYQFTVEDSALVSVPLDFRGELDVLSEINITTGGSTDLGAAYRLDLTFGLDLTAQPTEDGAGVGSCEDGIDNGDEDGIDAVDPDCAELKTLEQRVFLDVGRGAGSPELSAGLGLAASEVDAVASIGLLQAGINDASLTIGSNKTEDGAGIGSCEDGIDNGDGDGIDAADPDCGFITFDFTDSDDGRLTIEDLFNAIGGSPPAGATVAVDLSAKVDGTVPVEATLGGAPLAGGDIVISGTFDGPLANSLDLVNNITIDGSDLAASDLFGFSPCSNAEDDDGDGKVNDGCPLVGPAPEADAQCDNSVDDDGDSAINDGCPALADSEVESLALLDKILALLQTLADQLDTLEGADVGSSLSDPLPLVGSSFKDLFSYSDALQDLVDELQAVGEDPATECGNDIDDDHDGIVNDGCPTQDDVPESFEQCYNDTDDEDNNAATPEKDEDNYVNDGCPPAMPTLQALEGQIQEQLEDVLWAIPGIDPGNTDATLNISLDGDKDLIFELGAQVELTTGTAFNLDLSGLGGDLVGVDLVALETSGDLAVGVEADMDLNFGLDLDDLQPFVLGSTGLSFTGQADADDLVFGVSLGPLKVSIGTDTTTTKISCGGEPPPTPIGGKPLPTPTPNKISRLFLPLVLRGDGGDPPTDSYLELSVQYDDNLDNDDNGFVNDSCSLVDSADKGSVHLGASFDINLDGADDAKIDLAALDPSIAFTGVFTGVEQADCPTTTDHACAVLPLYFDGSPIATPPSHTLTVRLPDITDLNTLTLTMPDPTALGDLIAAQILDILLLESGLSRFLDVLASTLNGEILGFDLPLIGDQLDEAANFIQTLDDELVASVRDGGDPFDDLDPTPTIEDIQDALTPFAEEIGGALNGAGILSDTNGVDGVTSDDFVFTLFCEDEECVDYDQPATDVDEVRFYTKLGQSVSIPIDTEFDIGIPGLGLSSEGNVEGSASWSVDVGFGVNKKNGFFLLTQETADGSPETGAQCTGNYSDDDDDDVPNDGCPELILGANVTLPDTLEAELGFLLINVVDGDPAQTCAAVGSSSGTPCRPTGDEQDPKSSFGPQFTINLQDPGTGASEDGRFTFAEMTNAPAFNEVVTYDFEAEADINLHIETSIAGEAALPKLIGDLQIDWRWSLNGEDGGGALEDAGLLSNTCDDDDETNCFSIVLDDVVVDAGTFLSSFLGPIVGDVQQYTEPLQPVIDVLEEPIPVLTDLSGEPVTLLTLCEDLCPPEYAELDMLIYIIKLVSFINGLDVSTAGGDLTIPIGSGRFELNAQKLQGGPLAASESRSAFQTPIDGLDSLVNSLGNKAKPGGTLSDGEVQNTDGLKSIGLSFPFLEEPSQLLTMLFGQDVDLVLWEPPGLEAGFSYSQKFGPIWAVPPVFLEIGGSVSIKGRIGIGYDTQGLREVLFEGADAASLLNGLFLTDRNSAGQDVPELELRGELFANAQVSVLIFSAGAGGSVYLTIAIDLVDPNENGKLKYPEVATILEATANPFCLFSLEGKFGVRIFVFAEVDLFFWSKRWEKTLADIVLLSFSVQCEFNKVPVLASPEGDGVLRLHMGTHSDSRGSGSVGFDAKAEEFRVTQEADGSLTVVAFGYSQNYCRPDDIDGPPPCGGWTKVVADATSGGNPEDDKDIIALVDGAVGAETKCANGDAVDDDEDGFVNDGCPAQETIEEGSQCENNTDDDEDGFVNDGCPTVGELVPFTVPGELKGGPGNDQITGGHGNDKIDGGGGKDMIAGRGGDDQIIGGAGDDQINAGPGADTVYGDTSNTEWIVWDSCGDNAPDPGGGGNDSVEAGLGADQVCGQGGNDTLIGGISTTPAVGPAETGGECGNDVDDDGDGVIDDGCLDAGDEIHGGSGQDDIDGGDGIDWLYGDGDPDRIDGANGDDNIFGGDETSPGDVLVGGPGSDTILGGDGDDTIIGGNVIAGEPDEGDALLDGEGDADNILGDNATWDGTEFTLIDPDIGGADTMDGGPGSDVMRGQRGDDDMFGGTGDDDMDGNAGEDFIFGDNGTIDDRATADVTVTESGFDGVDTMHGSDGDDHMYGGGDGDFMYGDDGDDYQQGNSGDDTMRGGKHVDEMYGNAGKDTMYGDSGDDRMFGGSYESGEDIGDEMYGNAGDDVMIGDNGMITSSSPEVIQTSDPEHGGDDEMYGQGDDDIILGGSGGDDIWGNTGTDIILGDNGVVTRALAGEVERIETTAHENGGVDTIEGNEAEDIVLGGEEGDTISGNEESDVILGDNGVVVKADGSAQANDIYTTNPTYGGSDTITGNDGDDIILGGSGQNTTEPDEGDYEEGDDGDDITGGDGEDIILGDNGYITRTAAYLVERITTTDTDKGGGDIIAGDEDADIILGGHASDTISGGDAEDTILGDNGVVVLGDDPVDGTDIYSIAPDDGGSDTIEGNAGNDIILGGSGGTDLGEGNLGDTITGHTGEDIILGDNGYITRTETYEVHRIATTYPCDGADDTIAGSQDKDIILGGNASDTITGDDADDTILGDNGVVVRADGSLQANDVFSTDPTCGGSDTIEGNPGDDIILGGSGGSDLPGTGLGDTIEGNENQDIILGDNGYITRDGTDVVQKFESTDQVYGGEDTIYGNEGDDIAFGGTISDTISGNEGHDILLGDHGLWDSSRPLNQQFLCIYTEEADGGGGDIIHGNDGDDFILGQQANDELYGDADQDDMTGGHNVPGGADGDDVMYGESSTADGAADGSHGDVMLGDNGVISRTLDLDDAWVLNPFNGTYARVVQLFDVEMDGEPEVAPSVYGNDEMYGNDNDDIMYGQGGEDDMHGGAGDDYMEGNADSDYMEGDGEDDDMLGGTGPTTSNDPSTAIPGRTDNSTGTRLVISGTMTVTVPLGDVMYGDLGSDVMLGDNGIITRPLDDSDQWVTHNYLLFTDRIGGAPPRHPTGGSGARIDREVQMVDTAPGAIAGSDLMFGGPGDDDMYGQFDDTDVGIPAIGDELLGEEGEDAMVGDQGVIDNWVIDTPTQWIEPNEPFIDDHMFISGTLFRQVTLQQIPTGGNDRMTGGPDGDWMHGGAGGDLMNGNDGNDRLFGDDGDDAMWGGPHHDHLWGGHGDDHLDVRPRSAMTITQGQSETAVPADPLEWFIYGEPDNYQDVDYVYGGWDQDAMQANVADTGPVPGDRLIDWVGAYNVYYLCPGLYGEYVNTRDHSPAIIGFLQDLAAGDGAVDTATSETSGFNEVAIVFPNEAGWNSHPIHPDNPGHFTCGAPRTITPTVRSLAVELSFRTKGNDVTVTGEVLVVDEREEAVKGATVSAVWNLPAEAEPIIQTAETNNKGVAQFTVQGGVGLYTLTVADIGFDGYVFDPDHSELVGWIDTE